MAIATKFESKNIINEIRRNRKACCLRTYKPSFDKKYLLTQYFFCDHLKNSMYYLQLVDKKGKLIKLKPKRRNCLRNYIQNESSFVFNRRGFQTMTSSNVEGSLGSRPC